MAKTIFSGIQPSGTLHIGNYLGAIKQWVDLQRDNQAYFCIVDLHAITVPYDNEHLSDHVLNAAATYLAASIDPDHATIFVQSHVPAHTELAWLLSCVTPLGELKRMTQFKEKSERQKGEVTLGLFAYPVLQAADILLYQTDIVPVGEDQVQHIELARDIARRFHNRFEKEEEESILTIPKPQINKNTARIMSLSNPTKKMSKSDEPKSHIALTDEPSIIKKKIMSAVTETEPVFSFTHSGPAVRNLLTIYQGFSEEEPAAIEDKFTGCGYQEFKEALAKLLIEKLTPIQKKYKDKRQPEDLKIILAEGKAKAEQVANQTLIQVKQKMGLL